MTGPLMHFMPVIAGARHLPVTGDPYFDYVSLMSEFHGRPAGTYPPATELMNIPVDYANNHALAINGTPHRYPLGVDGLSPAPKGVSDNACWKQIKDDSYSSSIVVVNSNVTNLGASDFTIALQVRIDPAYVNTASKIAGRWGVGGGCVWYIDYYPVMSRLRFRFSINGSDTASQQAYFRMGTTTNDGLTKAQFCDDTWHDIVVSKVEEFITISLDGNPGYEVCDMNDTGTLAIFDPASSAASALHIGTIGSYNNGIIGSAGGWDGMIDNFVMTISGTTVLNINFNEYWSAWYVGNYPQNYHVKEPNNLNYHTGYVFGRELQDDEGLVRTSGSGLKFPHDVSLNFLSEDFTIETFDVKFLYTNTRIQHLIGSGWGKTNSKTWRLSVGPINDIISSSSLGKLVFSYSTDGNLQTDIILMTNIPLNQVNTKTIAISRFGNTIRAYLDGSMVSSALFSGSLWDNTTAQIPLSIYGNSNNSSSQGCVPETRLLAFRITKGIGRYRGSSYRVPDLPLPKSTT